MGYTLANRSSSIFLCLPNLDDYKDEKNSFVATLKVWKNQLNTLFWQSLPKISSWFWKVFYLFQRNHKIYLMADQIYMQLHHHGELLEKKVFFLKFKRTFLNPIQSKPVQLGHGFMLDLSLKKYMNTLFLVSENLKQ